MNAESTLRKVRELSERATLRPAVRQLPLAKPEELNRGPRRAIIPYEELHPPRIRATEPMRASGYKQRADQSGRGEGRPAREAPKDFMVAALDKTAA
jgi:hypothetical protein